MTDLITISKPELRQLIYEVCKELITEAALSAARVTRAELFSEIITEEEARRYFVHHRLGRACSDRSFERFVKKYELWFNREGFYRFFNRKQFEAAVKGQRVSKLRKAS